MAEVKNPLVERLMETGAHFGYSPSRRHPSTAKYIFGAKGGVELIDLEQTAALLETALAFVKERAAEHQTILFVGGKAEARGAVERIAKRLGQPYVASRWIGGTLTNFGEIGKRLARLAELSAMREAGELTKFTKLERLKIDREITDLENTFGGLAGMQKTPHALCIVDPKAEQIAVMEAHKMNLPIVAILNTDCDASDIQYPIPVNDSSRHAIELVLGEIAKAFEDGLASAPKPVAAV